MIAPIDSRATFEAGGESFTLRLNFRSLALAKKAGVNIFAGRELDPIDLAVVVRALATEDHPDMTDEQALALVVRGGEAVGKAIAGLFDDLSAEGNAAPKAKAAAS